VGGVVFPTFPDFMKQEGTDLIRTAMQIVLQAAFFFARGADCWPSLARSVATSVRAPLGSLLIFTPENARLEGRFDLFFAFRLGMSAGILL
jgi:hypothetical protein